MLSNFWEWVLIIVILVLVFGANNLHAWKAVALKKLENIKKTAAERKTSLNRKSKIRKTDFPFLEKARLISFVSGSQIMAAVVF